MNTDSSDHIYLLPQHLYRLQDSAKAFGWGDVVAKLSQQTASAALCNAITNHLLTKYGHMAAKDHSYRMRVLVARTGNIDIESSLITVTPGPSHQNGVFFPNTLSSFNDVQVWPDDLLPCMVYVDTATTTPSLFTTHKTTKRNHYDEARGRVGISHCLATEAEVFIVNPKGEIMEASLSTPYFFRSGRWVTPSYSCGGNIGTTRRWALEQHLCEEGIIKATDLVDEEELWISNGVRGFIKAKLCLETNHEGPGSKLKHQ